MANIVHDFYTEVFSTLIPPGQWTTSIIVSLPKKGDLSQMTTYRGISLLSITAMVFNKILLNRIRDHVDTILRAYKWVHSAVISRAEVIVYETSTSEKHPVQSALKGLKDCMHHWI